MLRLAGVKARIDHRTLEVQDIDRVPTTHLGPSIAAMERKGIRTMRGNRNRQQENKGLKAIPKSVSTPTPVPTNEECQAVLLAIAKQEPNKIDSDYQEQIAPYIEYFADADDKAEAFAFRRERMQEDMTTEAHG